MTTKIGSCINIAVTVDHTFVQKDRPSDGPRAWALRHPLQGSFARFDSEAVHHLFHSNHDSIIISINSDPTMSFFVVCWTNDNKIIYI